MPRTRNDARATARARVKAKAKAQGQELEQVKFIGPEPPEKQGPGISWGIRLRPLVDNPGIWAQVAVLDTPQQAQDAQSNLTKRDRLGINIPMGDGEWKFAARDCALFAVYRGGKKRRGSRSVRRVERPE
jgi:hypothetical protein